MWDLLPDPFCLREFTSLCKKNTAAVARDLEILAGTLRPQPVPPAGRPDVPVIATTTVVRAVPQHRLGAAVSGLAYWGRPQERGVSHRLEEYGRPSRIRTNSAPRARSWTLIRRTFPSPRLPCFAR